MEILWLEIADRPQLWRDLGFTVDETGRCVINGLEHRLVGDDDERRGVLAWGVSGIAPSVQSIDGIPTTVAYDYEQTPSTDHANGVFRLDHLVVRTSDTGRTASELETLGLEIQGNRSTNSTGTSVDMRFCWAGDTLLELVGPATPNGEVKPARLAGIAYATNDLEATVALLGRRSTTPVDAVQPGRRIAALNSEAGSTVPIAFMTPHHRS